MGEKVSMDERGRITIPSEIRRSIDRKEFKIRLLDRDTIILKAVDQGDLLEEIQSIRLEGDPERAHTDFSSVKDEYGAVKHEAP